MSTREQQNHIGSFESLLEAIWNQLFEAQVHFDIWKALWPTEDKVYILNLYRGFFAPTRDAHLNQFFIKMFNVTDNDLKAPSLYLLLSMLKKHPELAPGVDIRALRERIKKQSDLLSRIRTFRTKRAAHKDTFVVEPLQPVRFGEISKFLEELQDIFNEIHGAHKGSTWLFQDLPHSDDTSLLLDRLKEFHRPNEGSGTPP